MSNTLITMMENRIKMDMEEGDIGYYLALSLYSEYLTKIVTAGVVACLVDDADRHKYSLEYQLVRANSIGEWADVLNTALTGPAAQFFNPAAREVTRELTERVGPGDWRYQIVHGMYEVIDELGIEIDRPGTRVYLRQFFQLATTLRNKTRGHGAITAAQCSRIAARFHDLLDTLADNLLLFKLPWAYLHRNLSGKYRVFPLLGDCAQFDYLKRTREENFPNGVYIYLDHPVQVSLIFTESGVPDIFLPNGEFQNGEFEVLSYISNERRRQSGESWTTSPRPLPQSETQGAPILDQVGNLFANLPPRATGYISRPTLEERLFNELLNTDRHPIITLTGPGGIGKTTLALAALYKVAQLPDPPYKAIIWLSARDIDLLESGPKPVKPHVKTIKDLAQVVVDLMQPSERNNPNFDSLSYVERCLHQGTIGPTLFVMDNFETLQNPAESFEWLDTHIRLPNKVLITTRIRDFAGDYPIEVRGMSDDEAHELIEREARRLSITSLLTPEYIDELIKESNGHPYVMKILLGQVAKEGRTVKPERIVASSDQLLKALFERTYTSLTPGAQRIFLLLCSWRVLVPEIAIEAVCLRPDNERFDVTDAITQLRNYSLIEEVVSEADQQSFFSVPLAAAMYGRAKLEVSPFKVVVMEDRRLLMEFGASEDAQRGVQPRIDRLFRSIKDKIRKQQMTLDEALPVLEYLASRVPRVYLQLVDLVLDQEDQEQGARRAKGYLERFLQEARPNEREPAWMRMALICRMLGDEFGEIHALSEAALQPTVTIDRMSTIVFRINTRIKELKRNASPVASSFELKQLISEVAEAMDKHIRNLSATDCSRLAWLYINIGNPVKAVDIARIGLQRDPYNWHCQNIVDRFAN